MEFITLYKHFAKHPEAAWIMRPNNASFLYEFVRENDIKRVLDLGTGIGCSASVVALALKEKGVDFHIDTIEQFDKCVRLAGELIPEDLKPYITIHKADPMVWQTDKIPYQYFSTFKELPEKQYDLIINDGPGPFLEGEEYIDLPNGTIIKMLLENAPQLKPGTLVIYDGRLVSLKLIERYYGDNFFLVKAVQNSDMNIIQRKDNEVKRGDDKLELFGSVNYFENEKTVLPGNKPNTPGAPEVVAR